MKRQVAVPLPGGGVKIEYVDVGPRSTTHGHGRLLQPTFALDSSRQSDNASAAGMKQVRLRGAQ
jgi:hypothetical protein